MTSSEVEVCQEIASAPEHAPHPYPRPDYSKAFRCLAQACDENCCSGWSIPIDQRTLETYRAHPTLKPFAESLIVLKTQSAAHGEPAEMPLTHQGTCAFLNEEKLCGIHVHFGPGLLSNTCATYPREISYQSGHPEVALNLSCPEAARLTLLAPDLLGSGPWQFRGPRRYAHLPHATRLPRDFDPVLALRELCLLLIYDSTYALWQRVHILGDLAQRLELLGGATHARDWAQAHPVAVASVIDRITDEAAFHNYCFPSLAPDAATPLRFAGEVLRERLSKPPVPDGFLATVRAFQSGLGCDPEQTSQLSDHQITENFRGAYRLYVRPLLEHHPHLIENLLANHIFKYAYPLSRSQDGASPASPNAQHLSLVAHLALAQTLLVGLAAHHGNNLEPNHFVRLVQALSKAIEHRPASVVNLQRLLRDQQLTTPARQAQLLYLD